MNHSLRSIAIKTTLAVTAAMAFAAASATTLTTKLSVDNGFNAYLSTSASSTGTEFNAGNEWQSVANGSVVLGTAQTYYLQIMAYDQGGFAGLLGEFSLVGTGYHFADGSTTVLSGSSLITGNITGLNGNYTALTTYGTNGVGPWNTIGSIDSTAKWIWSGNNDTNDISFFSLEILADAPADVPEPASLGLLGLGLLALSRVRAKSK